MDVAPTWQVLVTADLAINLITSTCHCLDASPLFNPTPLPLGAYFVDNALALWAVLFGAFTLISAVSGHAWAKNTDYQTIVIAGGVLGALLAAIVGWVGGQQKVKEQE